MSLWKIAFKIASADEQSAAFLCFHALVIISGAILLKSHVTAARGTHRSSEVFLRRNRDKLFQLP